MNYIKKFESFKDGYNLFMAIRDGNFNLVETIIKSGIDANGKDDADSRSFLMLACSMSNSDDEFNNKYVEIAKMLIDAGANLDEQDKDGYTALNWAAYGRNINAVKLLIESGANWNLEDHDNRDFLDYLIGENRINIIELYPEQYKEYLMKKNAKKYNL